MKLCFDDKAIVPWVAERITGVATFGPAAAFGYVDDSGKPLAAAVYHDYHPEYRSIMMSFAASHPRWATRNTVRTFLAYPFHQLRVHKLRAAVAHTNERSLRLTGGVGFKREGTLADEFGPGIHAVMFRMFARDFKRMYGNEQQGKQLAA